jgi:hypothetical protein
VLREAHSIPLWPGEEAINERIVAAARAVLGEEAFAGANAVGRALSLDEAAAEALGWLAVAQRKATGLHVDADDKLRPK